MPASAPAGTVTSTCRRCLVTPSPLHALQGGCLLPLPPQPRHVICTWKNPWLTRCCPLPPQSEQVVAVDLGCAPLPEQVLQGTSVIRLSVRVVPFTASMKLRFNSVSRSEPRDGPDWPIPPIPPMPPIPANGPPGPPIPPMPVSQVRRVQTTVRQSQTGCAVLLPALCVSYQRSLSGCPPG